MKRMIALYKKGDIPYSVLKEHANILTIGGSETTATLLAGIANSAPSVPSS